MAKAKEKEEGKTESVDSILGKIKNIVTGKEKVVIADEEPASAPAAEEDDELLELTEVVEEAAPAEAAPADTTADADIALLQEIAETLKNPEPEPEVAPVAEEKFVDVLQEIDQALDVPTPAVEEAPQPAGNANVAQEVIQNEPISPPEVKKEFAEPVSQNIISDQVVTDMAEEKKEKILSEDIAAKSSKAIQSLLNNIPRPDISSPAFRSAITLEDIATESIRPMLKEWLDQNLETIVRDIVEREIKKIMPRE